MHMLHAVLDPPTLGFTNGYILIFLTGTTQNLTRLHAYAIGFPGDPCKLSAVAIHPYIGLWKWFTTTFLIWNCVHQETLIHVCNFYIFILTIYRMRANVELWAPGRGQRWMNNGFPWVAIMEMHLGPYCSILVSPRLVHLILLIFAALFSSVLF